MQEATVFFWADINFNMTVCQKLIIHVQRIFYIHQNPVFRFLHLNLPRINPD